MIAPVKYPAPHWKHFCPHMAKFLATPMDKRKAGKFLHSSLEISGVARSRGLQRDREALPKISLSDRT